MAYAAVNSLLYTVDHLLNSNRISFSVSTLKTLEFALDRVKSLQATLRKFDGIKNNSRGVMDSDARIRDEARRLEDAIESHASMQFLSQSQTHRLCPPTLSLTLDHLTLDIDCFAKAAQILEDEYIEELNKPSSTEEDEDYPTAVSPENDSAGNDCEMVGLSDLFLTVRNRLIGNETARTTVSISGMAGIGKTKLANKLFHDPLMKASFECRAFVRVGRRYQLAQILRAIMAQVNLVNDEMITEEGEDLDEYLKRILGGRKYLIVLDDTWDLHFFLGLKRALPNEGNGSRILLTSRKTRTIERGVRNAHSFTMPLLDADESWDLLCKKVFGEEECPRQLTKAGKKIAKNCEGLPLLILVVAAKLLEEQRSLEYWNEVAEKRNSVFEDACDQISEVLLLSYDYMRQYLKLCFLYIGVFPQNYIVRRSRIVKLWRAEGILEHSGNYAIDKFASHNLVLVSQRCFVRGRVHAYRLHPAYWYMCKREAENNKFFCTLRSYADGSIERLTGQRCFAIYNNVLFAIKEVHDSLASLRTARSVLCTGPYHQYQVPICSEWRLLRVLDALTIRFYEFPDELVKLIQLTYLSLTCDANLPCSISELWKLEFLIVNYHLSIKSIVDHESYLPVEIWDMKELRHLEIVGRNLPNPPPGAVLPNLRKLLGVGGRSCSVEILESIPNLRKLRIQIELAPDSAKIMSLFDHVSCLDELKSIKCVIVNPELVCEPIVPPPSLSISIESLKKLSLSGFGYSWDDMSKIAELPYLAVLKLHNYAFQGEKWEAKEKEFSNLKYLYIEDTDVVQWTAGDGSFPRLLRLTMKNCYNLEEIPVFASYVEVLVSSSIVIELVDCNPLAEICANQRYNDGRVIANYSWN